MHQDTVYWVNVTFWTVRTGTIPASLVFSSLNRMSGKNRLLPAETQPWVEKYHPWETFGIKNSNRLVSEQFIHKHQHIFEFRPLTSLFLSSPTRGFPWCILHRWRCLGRPWADVMNSTRDVPDIRLRLAGYPAVFFSPAPAPDRMLQRRQIIQPNNLLTYRNTYRCQQYKWKSISHCNHVWRPWREHWIESISGWAS